MFKRKVEEINLNTISIKKKNKREHRQLNYKVLMR